MDSLPLEIIANIARHIPKRICNEPDLPHLRWDHRRWSWDEDWRPETASRPPLVRPGIASLSRKWQAALEPYIYRDLHIMSTELDQFASIFRDSQAHRRPMLKSLYFRIVLPTYSDADCTVYESNQDRLDNNRAASDAVAALFSILAPWGHRPSAAVDLSISAYSPTDHCHRFYDRYKNSFIQLLDSDSLSVVPCIKSISLYPHDREFHPSNLLALTAKAPAIHSVTWRYDEPVPYLALRRPMRDEFARSLERFRFPPSMCQLEVHIDSGDPFRLEHRQPNLVFPHHRDPLCSAIHRSIGNAVDTLTYFGQVDPSLFWPYPGPEGGELGESFWPSVARLKVGFDRCSPCGRWYFRADPEDLEGFVGDPDFDLLAADEPLPVDTVCHLPPGYGSEQETQEALAYKRSLRTPKFAGGILCFRDDTDFRVVPNDELLVPLLEAFARAIAQMPALQSAELFTELCYPHEEWSVNYVAPGVESYYEKPLGNETALSSPRLFLHVQDWRP
jgi:hypothetical protein